MRSTELAVAAVLALVAPACSQKVGSDGKPIDVGRLRLHTYPPGARVWIDGELKIEATPATLVLKEGKYRLKIQAQGAESLEREIEIEAGEADQLTIDIPKPPDAKITVISDIVGAEVRINGYRRGVTPLSGVVTKPGPIDLTITSPEGRAKSVRGQLAIGEQKTIEVFFDDVASKPEEVKAPEVESRPAPKGYLTLGLQPDGEVFNAEGVSLGKSPIQKKSVDPGEHELILRSLDGRYEKRVVVEVTAEEPAVYRFMFRDSDQVPGWKPPDAGPKLDSGS